MQTKEKEFMITNPYGRMSKEAEVYVDYSKIGEVRNDHKHQQTCSKNRKNRKKRK